MVREDVGLTAQGVDPVDLSAGAARDLHHDRSVGVDSSLIFEI